jgi:hypothetical protein
VLSAFLLLPLAFTRRSRRLLRRHSVLTLGLVLLAAAGIGALSGCSSHTSAPAAATTTPVGSYTISITINGAPSATTVNLPITVQ